MSVFGEINSFIEFCERAKKWFGANKSPVVVVNPAERFLRLFEAHGIHRNQIPRYVGRRLSLVDVQDDESLLKVLDQKIIDDTAELFGVNREWLECASLDIYTPHDFYKRPEEFLIFLDGLLSRRSDLKGFVYTSATESSVQRSDTFILLEETVSIDEGQTITRYHICNNWNFNYGKSRGYLIACVAAAWRKDVCLHGRRVPHEFVSRYKHGQNLLGEDIRGHAPGRHWYPEDMALDPDKFIAGLQSRHDESVALETLIQIQSSDNRFTLDGTVSVLRGVPFSEKLKSIRGNEV
jgi:hypothetical protein